MSTYTGRDFDVTEERRQARSKQVHLDSVSIVLPLIFLWTAKQFLANYGHVIHSQSANQLNALYVYMQGIIKLEGYMDGWMDGVVDIYSLGRDLVLKVWLYVFCEFHRLFDYTAAAMLPNQARELSDNILQNLREQVTAPDCKLSRHPPIYISSHPKSVRIRGSIDLTSTPPPPSLLRSNQRILPGNV